MNETVLHSPIGVRIADLENQLPDIPVEFAGPFRQGIEQRRHRGTVFFAEIVGRMTIYRSTIDDAIYPSKDGNFANHVDIESKGIELEWEQKLGDTFRWLTNVSYIETEDERSKRQDHQSHGISNWLGNIILFYEPHPDLLYTSRLNYVGERNAPTGEDIDGYTIFDVTVSFFNVIHEGLTFRIGIHNLFDDDVIYLTDHAHSLTKDKYKGRTVWAQLSYDF